MGKSDSVPDNSVDQVESDQEFLRLIGQRIREARHQSGLSTPEIIDQAGCSKPWLYGVETGTQNFTILPFRRLLAVIGLKFSDLFLSQSILEIGQLLEKIDAFAKDLSVHSDTATDNAARLTEIHAAIAALIRSVQLSGSEPNHPS